LKRKEGKERKGRVKERNQEELRDLRKEGGKEKKRKEDLVNFERKKETTIRS